MKSGGSIFFFRFKVSSFFFSALLLFSGCGIIKSKPHSPTLSVTTPEGGTVAQSGDTPTPATVNTTTTSSALPLPAQQPVSFDSHTGVYSLVLSRDTSLNTKVSQTSVTGPVAFAPPAPPKLSEVKAEDRKAFLYIAMFAGLAAAVFGLVEGWHMVMVGGAVVAGAAYFGIFVENHPWLTAVIVGGAAFAVAGPYMWHVLGHKEVVAIAEAKVVAEVAAVKAII